MMSKQPRSLTVTIPLQLDRRVTPNGRAHWGTKRRLTDDMKHTTELAMLAASGLDDIQTWRLPLTLSYEIRHGKGRKRLDADNAIASLKPVQDAIAGVLAIDDRYFRFGAMEQTRDTTGRGEIVVTIMEEDNAT